MTDLPEDCARLPLSKPSLRSFSDLNAYHYEQCSRSDLADTDGANTAPACRRLSFRQVARIVCQFLRGKRGQEAQKGRAAKEKVDWQAVRDLIVGGDRQPPRHVRPGAGRGEGKGLKSVLKTRPSQESMPASPAPVPRHGAHLRVEDAHQRRDERMVRSHSEETYDDSEPRHRPFRRLQRGHSDSLDDYDDFSVRRGDWRPPAGTPRYGSYRQDSYRDEMSDYSEGTGLRSASPDTFQQGRGRGRPQHFDPSPERHSHSSFSSQRRRVSFKDGGRERGYHRDSYEDRSTHSGYDFHGGGRRRNSMEMYEVYQRREYEEPSQRRMRRPTRQDSLQYNKQKIYREVLDSDTASDKDSVEHLYISPRYAERLEDHHSTRKSVQFYLGPSENDAEHHPRREQAAFPPGPKSHHSARDDESLDTQVSDREAVVADDRYDAGQQYVVHEPYGDVPMYGHERDPTPPPLPEETGGMLSRFLNTVNHVPFIREDLLDSGVEDRSDRQPQSECGHSTEYQQSAGDRDHFHPQQQQSLEYSDGDAQYQHSGREDRGGGAQREVGVDEPRSQQRRRQSKFYAGSAWYKMLWCRPSHLTSLAWRRNHWRNTSWCRPSHLTSLAWRRNHWRNTSWCRPSHLTAWHDGEITGGTHHGVVLHTSQHGMMEKSLGEHIMVSSFTPHSMAWQRNHRGNTSWCRPSHLTAWHDGEINGGTHHGVVLHTSQHSMTEKSLGEHIMVEHAFWSAGFGFLCCEWDFGFLCYDSTFCFFFHDSVISFFCDDSAFVFFCGDSALGFLFNDSTFCFLLLWFSFRFLLPQFSFWFPTLWFPWLAFTAFLDWGLSHSCHMAAFSYLLLFCRHRSVTWQHSAVCCCFAVTELSHGSIQLFAVVLPSQNCHMAAFSCLLLFCRHRTVTWQHSAICCCFAVTELSHGSIQLFAIVLLSQNCHMAAFSCLLLFCRHRTVTWQHSAVCYCFAITELSHGVITPAALMIVVSQNSHIMLISKQWWSSYCHMCDCLSCVDYCVFTFSFDVGILDRSDGQPVTDLSLVEFQVTLSDTLHIRNL